MGGLFLNPKKQQRHRRLYNVSVDRSLFSKNCDVWTLTGAAGAICAGKLCRHLNCLGAAIFRINGGADHY